jgi:peptidyl-prolyl cis-trans isomerase B (cyclophilin B)
MGKIQKLREQKKIEEQLKQEEKSKRIKKIVTSIIAGLGVLILIIYGAKLLLADNKKTALNSSAPTSTSTPSASPQQIFPSVNAQPSTSSTTKNMIKNSIALIETDRGTITLELYNQDAPKTVNNFIALAKKGFFNGLKFHRVISDFVIQGGDPKGDGTGGPGYTFQDEINPWSLGLSEQTIQSLQSQGYKYTHDLTSHKVTVGALAMANSGPNTNGSQFFIVTQKDQAHLDGLHTVFGKVVDGMNVVRQIQQGDIMKEVLILNQ